MYERIDILQIDKNIQNTLGSSPAKDLVIIDDELYYQLSESTQKKIKNSQERSNIDPKTFHDFYLLDTVELVEHYKATLQTPIKINFLSNSLQKTNTDSNGKQEIIYKYIDKIKNYNNIVEYPYIKNEPHATSNTIYNQKCSRCDSTDLTESIEFTGVIICLECGTQETTMNLASSIRLNHNDSKRVNICAKYSYDKKSHFLNCINQYQGKHKTGIDSEIISLIEVELEKYNLIDHAKKTKRAKYRNVTKEHIFLFIKELKLTKCYGDINLIYHVITGTPLNDISHLTEKLLQDFDQFVQMHYKLFPCDSERKNFNYQHLLYQLLLRHKYNCNANEFNFLKTIDRKYYHDEICRIIFENLGWNYSSLF